MPFFWLFAAWKLVHVLRGWADISLLKTVSEANGASRLARWLRCNSTKQKDERMLKIWSISTRNLRNYSLPSPKPKMIKMEWPMKKSCSKIFPIYISLIPCHSLWCKCIPDLWFIHDRYWHPLHRNIYRRYKISIPCFGACNRTTYPSTNIPPCNRFETLRNSRFDYLWYKIQSSRFRRWYWWCETTR